jgi:hypothetical protein
MTFHLAETIDDVLALALEPAPGVSNDGLQSAEAA